MDPQPPTDAEGAGSAEPADLDPSGPFGGHPLAGPEADALANEAEEIRRLVDAGAGTPEELRALAARLRDHRAREEALWRAQIKPTLKAKRGITLARGPAGTLPSPEGTRSPQQTLVLGLGLLGLVALVVLLAATGSFLLVLLPVVAVLVAAWWMGRQQER